MAAEVRKQCIKWSKEKSGENTSIGELNAFGENGIGISINKLNSIYNNGFIPKWKTVSIVRTHRDQWIIQSIKK